MAEETPVWNMSESEWQLLLGRVKAHSDALEDGAYARIADNPDTGAPEISFYATALNKPADWHYPFLEEIADSRQLGALVGLARHEPPTGFVQFEVFVAAAAQALRADYESGADALDYVAYEQAVEQAIRGTPADRQWLRREFARLVLLTKP